LESHSINLQEDLARIKAFESERELQDYLASFGANIVLQLGDEIDRLEEDIKVSNE
jgi:hypothetical protein